MKPTQVETRSATVHRNPVRKVLTISHTPLPQVGFRCAKRLHVKPPQVKSPPVTFRCVKQHSRQVTSNLVQSPPSSHPSSSHLTLSHALHTLRPSRPQLIHPSAGTGGPESGHVRSGQQVAAPHIQHPQVPQRKHSVQSATLTQAVVGGTTLTRW